MSLQTRFLITQSVPSLYLAHLSASFFLLLVSNYQQRGPQILMGQVWERPTNCQDKSISSDPNWEAVISREL